MKEKSPQVLLNALILVCWVAAGFVLLTASRWEPGQLRGYRFLAMAGLIFAGLMAWFFGRRMKGWMSGLHSLLISVILLFWIAESVFLFYSQSSGIYPTLAHFNFYRNHFQQVNRLGYRDAEADKKSCEGKKKVFFLGDSFTEGAGIALPADRFSNRYCELNQNACCFNLGISGTETRRQLEMLRDYPVKPDQVVLVWVPNDILKAANDHGKTHLPADPYASLKPPIRFLVSHSYTLDFLFWRFRKGDDQGWIAFNENVFSDAEILSDHVKDVIAIASLCDSLQANLSVLMFPYLDIPELSIPWKNTVRDSLLNRGLNVKSVDDWADVEILKNSIANPQDPHPNETLHLLVADSLDSWLQSN